MRTIKPGTRYHPPWAVAVAVGGLLLSGLVVGAAPAQAAVAVTVRPDVPVYLVDAGDTVNVGVRLTTAGDVPTDEDITINYEVAGQLVVGTGANQRTLVDTAEPGVDFELAPGTLEVPAGTPSGTVVSFPVKTFRGGDAEYAKTITLRLSSTSPGVTIPNEPPSVVINAYGFPYLDSSLPIADRVEDLISRMTVEEKVGQMTQPERPRFASNLANSNSSVENIAVWKIGSVLSGGGSSPPENTPQGWADMVDNYQLRALRTRLQIPLIYGVDSVHGHQLLYGSTIFPHNIGLGATNNPALVEQTGAVTAKETRATGPQWSFSPAVCVSRNIRWGRTYECFSEDPARVIAMTTMIDGLQGTAPGSLAETDRILATAKHFAGDGGTQDGIDQGVYVGTREEFMRVHVAPYVAAIERNVGSIMPSFSSVNFTDSDEGPVKMHGHRDLLTNVLKGELGFDGFLISDWNGIYQLPGTDREDARDSFNAGMDMNMVPSAYRTFITDMIDHVTTGAVPMERIDDALRRILAAKFKLGLFDKPFTDRSNFATIGSPEHRKVARQAAAESQVLLKNDGDLLPLPKDAKIYLAGRNADDLGNQTGGWTITWQGASGTHTIGTTIFQAIEQVAPEAEVTLSPTATAPTEGHDVGVVVVGETPYAEGVGDVRPGTTRNLNLVAADRAAVERVCTDLPCVVLVVSGRPMTISDQLPLMDALVASWLPGTEGTGVADVLFGDVPFSGRLPVTWPANLDQEPINVGDEVYDPAFPYGWGLRTDSSKSRLAALRDSLAEIRNDGQARAAQAHLDKLLRTASNWNSDGSVRNEAELYFWLLKVADKLDKSSADTFYDGDLLVSVARDIAQRAIITGADGVPSNAYALTADAEHALWTGQLETAVMLLAQAAGHR